MKYKKLSPLEHRVYQKAKELTDEFGYILWDVDFAREGSERYLRVLIDSEDGISISDCEKITKPLDKWLDEEDFIEESYIFEVGSAGLGRDLKTEEHLKHSIGKEIEIKLYSPDNGSKEVQGFLIDAQKEYIIVDGKKYLIENIAKISQTIIM